MGNSKKLMLIGWDAADWKIIHELIEAGKLPTLKRLINEGTMGNLRTLSPVLSPMLWTSIATGKRPYKHGIYGFTEPSHDEKSVQPMTNVSRRSKAIWNILNQQDMESIVVGWWPSHPAEPINGVMVSDFFHKVPKRPGDPWPLMPNCVHPNDRLEELVPHRMHPSKLIPEFVRPFIPLGHEIDQDSDSRLAMCMRMICECVTIHDTAEHLLDNQDWDFAAIYYDAIDHFCHGFMRYRAPRRPHISESDFRFYKDVVTNAYRFHDMLLAKLIAKADKDTTFILMSDHGFHPDHLRPAMIPAEPAGPAIEHRDYGIFLAWGPDIKQDALVHSASLLDIAPTILTALDLPVGEDMDGRALTDIFKTPREVKTIPSWEDVPGNDGQHPPGVGMDAEASQAALDQLVALGYIEAPDDNVSVAVANCKRELDYNLAVSYMDAGMYGEAVPLLLEIYRNHPLEFRYGVQLANCLRAMNRTASLETLVNDMNSRWRVAAEQAREALLQLKDIREERLQHWHELKKIDEEHANDPNKPLLALTDTKGNPMLFSEEEKMAMAKIRGISKGNTKTLDFLSASIASSNGDFEAALDYLTKADVTKSTNPGLHFHIGIVYLGLRRYSDAEKSFLKALEFDEFHPRALMGLARTHFETERWDSAIDFGKQATGLKYHFPLAHYYLGRVRLKKGETELGIESLKLALEQNPNFAEAHRVLAEVLRDENPDAADLHLETVEELDRQNKMLTDEEEKIELPVVSPEEFREQLPILTAVTQSEENDVKIRTLSAPRPKGQAKSEDRPQVIIVSGLPRSGTSMMMQMLKAGGITLFTDSERVADENNPKGYFEAEIVKTMPRENKWMLECESQAVKVVAPLVPFLPQRLHYKAIVMDRDIDEILDSQSAMIQRLEKEAADIEHERLGKVYIANLHRAIQLLNVHGNDVIRANYGEIVANPQEFIDSLREFLGQELEIESMKKVVSPALYRQKKNI